MEDLLRCPLESIRTLARNRIEANLLLELQFTAFKLDCMMQALEQKVAKLRVSLLTKTIEAISQVLVSSSLPEKSVLTIEKNLTLVPLIPVIGR